MKKYKIRNNIYFRTHKNYFYFHLSISFKRIITRPHLVRAIFGPSKDLRFGLGGKECQNKCLVKFKEVGNYKILAKNESTGIWAERV